jgi:hypothetical protein
METIRPLARSTIQPLFLGMSDDEMTGVSTYYGIVVGPSDLVIPESTGTVTIKSMYCIFFKIPFKNCSLTFTR